MYGLKAVPFTERSELKAVHALQEDFFGRHLWLLSRGSGLSDLGLLCWWLQGHPFRFGRRRGMDGGVNG
jgi:hypothetical protein